MGCAALCQKAAGQQSGAVTETSLPGSCEELQLGALGGVGGGAQRAPQPPGTAPVITFLFQRARQLDEELNRRGSPVPKKVGELSPRDCMFGKAGASLLAVPCCL